MCQRSAGAPVVAWANVPIASLTYEGAEPALYRSSESTQRGFCPKCGSSLLVVDDGSEIIDITLATLDHPEEVTPAYDSNLESSPPWMRWESRNH
ncbi:MAG: GFA family protein [Stenomitos rutilans HA7619-LM2]|nr:GFA family protein [Stenomitos rutilans HA7619-LM2]